MPASRLRPLCCSSASRVASARRRSCAMPGSARRLRLSPISALPRRWASTSAPASSRTRSTACSGWSRGPDMDVLSQLMNGFAVALTPQNLLWCLVGTTLGTAIGVLPGLGPALTIALLLPITFKVEPTSAFILFAGIYYGAMYGGSTTSILLNTPGESATIVTALEGNRMARMRGARHFGNRLVHCRHDRHARHHVSCPSGGRSRAALWAGRLFRAHGVR